MNIIPMVQDFPDLSSGLGNCWYIDEICSILT